MKTTTYADDEGNSITIESAANGVDVCAIIKTKPQYTGGANASEARKYARQNNLK